MNKVDRDEEVLEELFFNLVIYADNKSSSMAEVRATKWKIMNSLSVSLQMQIALPSPTLPLLGVSSTTSNLEVPPLTYIRHGRELVDGRCWPNCHITCSRAS